MNSQLQSCTRRSVPHLGSPFRGSCKCSVSQTGGFMVTSTLEICFQSTAKRYGSRRADIVLHQFTVHWHPPDARNTNPSFQPFPLLNKISYPFVSASPYHSSSLKKIQKTHRYHLSLPQSQFPSDPQTLVFPFHSFCQSSRLRALKLISIRRADGPNAVRHWGRTWYECFDKYRSGIATTSVRFKWKRLRYYSSAVRHWSSYSIITGRKT